MAAQREKGPYKTLDDLITSGLFYPILPHLPLHQSHWPPHCPAGRAAPFCLRAFALPSASVWNNHFPDFCSVPTLTLLRLSLTAPLQYTQGPYFPPLLYFYHSL